LRAILLLAMVLAALALLVAPAPVRAAEGELQRALVLIKAEQFKEALPLLDGVIAANPNRAAAYLLRGIVRFELKQWDPALADYEAALRLVPNNAEALYRRGYWWATDGNDRKALADYDRAIRIEPGNARYLYARATAYERLLDWQRAADAYAEVLVADPTRAAAVSKLQDARAHLGQSSPVASTAGSAALVPPLATAPATPTPTPTGHTAASVPAAAGGEPAEVLTRVLTAQAGGDLAALEREWDLTAVGAEAARLQRARLQAAAASLRIDEFQMRVRATMYSADGSLATVRAEVSFRASHASGKSRWDNGVLGVLRRSGAGSPWIVIGVVPDELLNNELAERADRQAGRQPQPRDPASPRLASAYAHDGAAASRAGLLVSGVLAASLTAGPQAGGGGSAQPITYAQLNRNIDAAMNREFGVTKLKFLANSMNTSIGQVPGAGDVASWFYQAGDTGWNSIEVLGETMKHGFTRIGALKAAQVFAGVVQLVSELVPPADVASDVFQYRLEAITANAEIRRSIYNLKHDLETGQLQPGGARLRLADGVKYPPGVRVSVESAADALIDPSNPSSAGISYEGGLVRVVVTTAELLIRASPRLHFEVVAQVIIDPGSLRYEAFDDRVAKFVGAVRRGNKWVMPVQIGRQAAADASIGAPILTDFQRARLQLEQGVHPDSAATWAWQPCRGTQRLAVRLADASSTLPVAVHNAFLNRLNGLAVVDSRGQRLERITLGPGETLTDLRLVGIDPSGTSPNLTQFVRRRFSCVELSAPDSAVVAAGGDRNLFSLAATGPGRTSLGVRVAGDQGAPDLVLDLPIVVTSPDVAPNLPIVVASPEQARGKTKYAWVLMEIVDYENAGRWATADAHPSYVVNHSYSPGVYSASTTYEGDDPYGQGLGGALGLKAVFTGMPKLIYPDQPVSLTLSFTATENSAVKLSFSGSASADFDKWDVAPGGVTRGSRPFVNKDGDSSFTISTNNNAPSYNETLTGHIGPGTEGGRIALRTKFSMNVAMGTNYIYEWKRVAE
jgi:tetratricopeptide (TPR) repeat protein